MGELRAVFEFLQTFWGLLSAATLLLPVTVQKLNVLLPTSYFADAPNGVGPGTFTMWATVGAMAALLLAIYLRGSMITRSRNVTSSIALSCLLGAGACLRGYIANYQRFYYGLDATDFMSSLTLILQLHAGTFTLLTFAFSLIAVAEYVNAKAVTA